MQSRVGRLTALLPSIELARQEIRHQEPTLDEKAVHRMSSQLGAEVLTTRTRGVSSNGTENRRKSRIEPICRFSVSLLPETDSGKRVGMGGEVDEDAEAGIGVLGNDSASVKFDRSSGNRES